MGMFMDADSIPLAFSVFDGNQNEQPSMSPLEQKIIKDFEPLTLSYVRMPVFLRLPTENSTVSKAEDLLQHSLLKS